MTTSQAKKSFSCQKGVRQSCIIIATLIISPFCSVFLYIRGLETKMAERETGVLLMDAILNMVMFADDIVLLSTSTLRLRKH